MYSNQLIGPLHKLTSWEGNCGIVGVAAGRMDDVSAVQQDQTICPYFDNSSLSWCWNHIHHQVKRRHVGFALEISASSHCTEPCDIPVGHELFVAL